MLSSLMANMLNCWHSKKKRSVYTTVGRINKLSLIPDLSALVKKMIYLCS